MWIFIILMVGFVYSSVRGDFAEQPIMNIVAMAIQFVGGWFASSAWRE